MPPPRAPSTSPRRRAATNTAPARQEPHRARAAGSASSKSRLFERRRGSGEIAFAPRTARRRRRPRARRRCRSSTDGTPEPSASSGGWPNPSYSDNSANARARPYNSASSRVGDVAANRHLCAIPALTRRCRQILVRIACDCRRRSRAARPRWLRRDRLERANQIGEMAPVEHGADEQHQRLSARRACCERRHRCVSERHHARIDAAHAAFRERRNAT